MCAFFNVHAPSFKSSVNHQTVDTVNDISKSIDAFGINSKTTNHNFNKTAGFSFYDNTKTISHDERTTISNSTKNAKNSAYNIFDDELKSKIFKQAGLINVVFPKKQKTTNTVILNGNPYHTHSLKIFILNIKELNNYAENEIHITKKSLITDNGKKLNSIGNEHKVINIVCNDKLTIIGQPENVRYALSDIKLNSEEDVTKQILIEEKWRLKFSAKLLNQISQNNSNVKLTLKNPNFLNITGLRGNVDSAIDQVFDIINELENHITNNETIQYTDELKVFNPNLKNAIYLDNPQVTFMHRKRDIQTNYLIIKGSTHNLSLAREQIFRILNLPDNHKIYETQIDKKYQEFFLSQKGLMIERLAKKSHTRVLFQLNTDNYCQNLIIAVGLNEYAVENFQDDLEDVIDNQAEPGDVNTIEAKNSRKNKQRSHRSSTLATGSMKIATKSSTNMDVFNEHKPIDAPALTENNKGYKMLQKMGWSPGSGADPVIAIVRPKKQGLGFGTSKDKNQDDYK